MWSLVGWSGTAGSPFLIDRPLLLMMLAPRAPFVLLAAPSTGFLLFVVLGTIRLSLTDASWYLVGCRVPQRARVGTTGNRRWHAARVCASVSRRLVEALCRSRMLAGAVLFFRPNGRFLGVAGAFGVPAKLAASMSLFGTFVYLVVIHVGMSEVFP